MNLLSNLLCFLQDMMISGHDEAQVNKAFFGQKLFSKNFTSLPSVVK